MPGSRPRCHSRSHDHRPRTCWGHADQKTGTEKDEFSLRARQHPLVDKLLISASEQELLKYKFKKSKRRLNQMTACRVQVVYALERY